MGRGSGETAPSPEATCRSDYNSTLAARRRLYGPNTSLSYEQPLMIVRGSGTYLYDDQGVEYLDCVNNVSHVGHGNPEVASAICSQLHTLNTNSRYLHPGLPAYTEALLNTLNGRPAFPPPPAASAPPPEAPEPASPPPPAPARTSAASASAAIAPTTTTTTTTTAQAGPDLSVLYLVCSGSEANDLALRLVAASRPGATHVAVMGGAYHGHTAALIPLSPYKFWGRGGEGRAPHVHVVPCPDPYRGEHLDGAAAARAVLEAARRAGGRLGAFFGESLLSCGGQVVPPAAYMRDLYGVFRSEGVVLVADEVQCGFGRCGAAFWGFQALGVRPDIVTMGKPIGNGYPMAALATTRALADAFAAPGMEYFNTYGGSTAAVAAGLAVLRVLTQECLQQRAAAVGDYLLAGLQRLVAEHEVLGEARGLGLFVGLEVVADKASRRHAPVTARWIKERMKARRVLLSTDGPYDNVIKMKPPLVFGFREVDVLLSQLSEVMARELTAAVRSELLAQEEGHWAAVMAPRQAAYRDNERRLFAGGAVARL
ncbi:hypothetical protein GPECTOR_34g769 [Gonium pectorale]|uniref:Uncharacterized protein n=1 Tax=Gonium pectorale TaxID=33097 RepID=A0A150GE36_GONPE|nr:hypothetical protein GPECTOR_34g769 [Gonium pectorale]|eukprot:KXZ47610.1 hypothetical protein GPECTOR_34g769 [Gonium pectorale]